MGGYFLVRWPSVQTILTRQIAKQISASLNAKFEVGKVDIVFFRRVLLRDIYIEDQQGETLLKADRLTATIQNINRAEKKIRLNQLNLDNAEINLRSSADSVLNLRFILDAVASENAPEDKWNFSINSVSLRDSKFSYKKHQSVEKKHGINFGDISITDLNLLANDIHTTPDTVHFNIRYLNLNEGSGFTLNHFSSGNSISGSGMTLRDLHIVTPLSRLNLSHLEMTYNGFDSFSDFISRVNLNSRFNPSLFSFHDIAYFAPRLHEVDLELGMSGQVSGRINNLRGNDITISGPGETFLSADLNMVGLPAFSETFILLDLHEFTSSVEDVISITGAAGVSDNLVSQLPVDLTSLGRLNYKGKFTGFTDDFVAFGEFNSSLGTLFTDILLKPDSDNQLNFSGQLRAAGFDAGTLAGSESLGRISFNAGLNGNISPRTGVYADMEGIIDSVFILGYNYNQVQLSGKLAERKFEGYARIDDPNIMLDFLGSIDLSAGIPAFDFAAEVVGASLYDLNIIEKDTSLVLSFVSRANFHGSNIDNLIGEIELVSARFERGEDVFSTENAILEASGSGDNRSINLCSDLVEAGISGSYHFATIAGSFREYINNYLPSFREYNGYSNGAGNSFSFNINIKDASGFTEFFLPDLSVASGTMVEGLYDPAGLNTLIRGHTDELRFRNHLFRNIDIGSNSSDSSLNISSRAEHVLIANRFNLENFDIISEIRNDSVSFFSGWDNRKALRYRGNVSALMSFVAEDEKRDPLVNIDINPSSIIIADSLWNIRQSRVMLDSTSIMVDNFIFGRSGQQLRLHGKLSESPFDSLHMEFNQVDIINLDYFITNRSFNLAGIINGSATFSDLRRNPVFTTNLEIGSLLINNQDFGDLGILSKWNNTEREIAMHLFSDREGERIIDISGFYLPDSSLLDFDVTFSKINLRTFDGYLDEVFASLRGTAGGNLKLGGSVREPLFNGNVFLQKTSFRVDYLRTLYNFTHNITVENNAISFRDLVLYDQNHNMCRVNGSLTSSYFRDFNLNIYLYPENFMVLNTNERDNDLFYGQVFGSGLVHISGMPDNLTMNISARTNRNTRFFIPLQRSGDVADLHFLSFKKPSGITEEDEDPVAGRYTVDLSGIRMNFNLEVTPDAEVQIIFDSKIGDIIRGRGNGSFKMEINTMGQFNMLGEYTIDQGDYLFTLQNVINKRFDIERGSRIIWSGDPFDADVDLRALYRVRASPRNLFDPGGTLILEDSYSRRQPVECLITMRNKLMTPDISFSIDFPSNPDISRDARGILNTEEKISRQFLALLVINNFVPDQEMTGIARGSTIGTSATGAGITTVSEFFSNQLSNWLSQLSRDVDFGINWRPGDEITPDEVELALSTQLLNDRISINGHVDVGGRQTNTSNIVGDVDVDIKLNRSGKLRLKAFTRANDNLIRPHLSPYTQGVGLFYREDFDSFDELLSRYFSTLLPRRKEEKVEEEHDPGEERPPEPEEAAR